MKNPFKKQSMVDTLVNVGVGGAANVAIDSLITTLDLDILKNEEKTANNDTLINAIKIGLGAIGGSMVSNKYLRAAADGVAVVGVSNLISGLMADSTDGAHGLPSGTIGYRRIRRAGNPSFRRRAVSGIANPANFMGK